MWTADNASTRSAGLGCQSRGDHTRLDAGHVKRR